MSKYFDYTVNRMYDSYMRYKYRDYIWKEKDNV